MLTGEQLYSGNQEWHNLVAVTQMFKQPQQWYLTGCSAKKNIPTVYCHTHVNCYISASGATLRFIREAGFDV